MTRLTRKITTFNTPSLFDFDSLFSLSPSKMFYEIKDNTLIVDLPGVEREDISVTQKGDKLQIKLSNTEVKNMSHYITLNMNDVKVDKVTYKNGRLTITVVDVDQEEEKVFEIE